MEIGGNVGVCRGIFYYHNYSWTDFIRKRFKVTTMSTR